MGGNTLTVEVKVANYKELCNYTELYWIFDIDWCWYWARKCMLGFMILQQMIINWFLTITCDINYAMMIETVHIIDAVSTNWM
jgi:hypothetical protein